MSFVITLYVREGIVMASDSRLTLNAQQQTGGTQTIHLAVGQSDANYKTFLTPTGVGISTYGAADIGGVPIAGYIESFINDVVVPGSLGVEQVAQEILNYFRGLQPIPDTQFHVAGYKRTNHTSVQEVWQVSVAQGQRNQLNPPGHQGASWGGESDILTRLIQPVGLLDQQGALTAALPHQPIPWEAGKGGKGVGSLFLTSEGP